MAGRVLQFVITGVANGAIYALIALGFTLIYNSKQIINFAQGEFVVLGGLAAYTFYSTLHLPIWLAVILAVAVVTALGIAMERLVILPLSKAAAISLIIATIGVSLTLRTAAMIVWGKEALSLPHFFGDKPVPIFGATILPQQIFIISIMAVIVIAMQLFFRRTMTGKAMLATSMNPGAASLMGIKGGRMVMYSFALAAALGAVAGVSIAPLVMMSFNSGASLGIKGFSAAILGGLTNPVGAVLGGLSLGVIESVGAGLISSAFKEAIALIVLLAVLLLKPTGVFGKVGSRR